MRTMMIHKFYPIVSSNCFNVYVKLIMSKLDGVNDIGNVGLIRGVISLTPCRVVIYCCEKVVISIVS